MSINSLCPSLFGSLFSAQKICDQVVVDTDTEQEVSIKSHLDSLDTLKFNEISDFFKVNLPETVESIELTQILDEIQKRDSKFSIEEHLKNLAPILGLDEKAILTQPLTQEQSCFIFRFFSTLFNAFFTAFNFFDDSEPPTSIYEKQVLIQIYQFFFQMPILLGFALQSFFVVAWQAYVVAFTALVAISAAAYVYAKWLRPFPTVIPLCENIDEMITKEHPEPIRGMDREMEKLISCINRPASAKKNPVVLRGDTGVGKTTLIYQLYQKIKSGDVPKALKDKRIVFIYGGKLMAKTNTGFGDKVKEITTKLSGFEKNTIIFIDELQAIAENPVCLELVKEWMRKPGYQFITATTIDGLQKIKALDKDKSFLDPCNDVKINTWLDTQVKSLLEEIADEEARDISMTSKAIDKIYELSNENQKDMPQPRKAIKLLRMAISACRENYEFKAKSKDLETKESRLQELIPKSRRQFGFDNDKNIVEINTLIKEIADLQAEQTKARAEAQYVRELIVQREAVKDQLLKDAALMMKKQKEKESLDEALQTRYLFSYFYLMPALKTLIDKKIADFKKDRKVDLEVNEKFVENLFKDQKKESEELKDRKKELEESQHHLIEGAFKGILENPSNDALKEVQKVLKISQDWPHGGERPNFDDLMKEHWKTNQKRLTGVGFSDFEKYNAVVCQACTLVDFR